MRSWAPGNASPPARPARRNYDTLGSASNVDNALAKRRDSRKNEWHCFTWLAVAGCLFLVVSLGALIFFLSQSDLEIAGKSSSSGTVLGVLQECEVDADCDTCCTALRGDNNAVVSLNPCLLPTNKSHPFVCENNCCVAAPPLFAADGTPCDDGRWCTYGDKCFEGECAGVQRDCQDADFCTVEECSETFQTCVSGQLNDAEACEQVCDSDQDCRTGYYCLPSGHCGKLPDTNATLRFTHYEIERCLSAPGEVFSMTQHYVTYEKAYVGPQGETRFRVVDRVELPELPPDYNDHRPAFDASPTGVPLVEVKSVSESRVVVIQNDTYTQTTVSLTTACQEMDPRDLESCATVWADRQYEFEIVHKDCVHDADHFTLCLPSEVPRAYTMFLSIVDCPLVAHTLEIVPAPSLWFESPFDAGTPITELPQATLARALFRTDQSGWLDPFLVNVSVCLVDPHHRLAECASNEQQEGCPFRGCHGWSPHDTPVLSTKTYMVRSEWTSESGLDAVVFCRDKFKYDEGGCAAGECRWGDFGEETMAVLGGVDGFEFTPFESEGTLVVVDVGARLETCENEMARNGSYGGRRRLQQKDDDGGASHAEESSRFIGVLRKAKN